MGAIQVIISDSPDWLIQASSGQKASDRGTMIPLSPGRRNADLTSLGGLMRRKGFTADQILHYLSALNSAAPNPLPPGEVASIASSLNRYEPSDIGTLTEQRFSNMLAESFDGIIRFCPAWGWVRYDGTKWQLDAGGLHTQEHAKNLVMALYQIVASQDVA
jgi:hypothetical protein